MHSELSVDNHGQPKALGFNYKRNKAKVVFTLLGILDGIHADQKMTEAEFLFLTAWKENDYLQLNDGDLIDIREQIDDVLADGVISTDEKRDLVQMLNDILYYGGLLDESAAPVNHLLGFLNGITADEELNDIEIHKLNDLLSKSDELASVWPGNALKARLEDVLKDDVVEDSEREDLMNLIKSVSGQRLMDTGLAYGMAADFSTCQETKLSLKDMRICFTGQFLSGSRKQQEEKAKKMGATVSSGISRKVDFLILGAVASRDWMYSSYGRKIEAALKSRSEGHCIEIINEEAWNDLVALA